MSMGTREPHEAPPPPPGGGGGGATAAGVLNDWMSDHGPTVDGSDPRTIQYNVAPSGRSNGASRFVCVGCSPTCQTAKSGENAVLVETSMVYVIGPTGPDRVAFAMENFG